MSCNGKIVVRVAAQFSMRRIYFTSVARIVLISKKKFRFFSQSAYAKNEHYGCWYSGDIDRKVNPPRKTHFRRCCPRSPQSMPVLRCPARSIAARRSEERHHSPRTHTYHLCCCPRFPRFHQRRIGGVIGVQSAAPHTPTLNNNIDKHVIQIDKLFINETPGRRRIFLSGVPSEPILAFTISGLSCIIMLFLRFMLR